MISMTVTLSGDAVGSALANDPEEACYALCAMAGNTPDTDMEELLDHVRGSGADTLSDLRVYLWALLQTAGGPPNKT